jgi:hypothetical protein
MRISIHTTAALTLSLFTPACDDMTDLEAVEAEAGADDEADDEAEGDEGEFGGGAQHRCFPQPCTDPPLGNTNWVGHNPLDTVTQDAWNVPTQMANGSYMRFTGASCPNNFNLYKFNATAHGELVFYKSGTGGNTPSNLIRGEAVKGCKFNAEFASTASFASPQAVEIRIYDAVKFASAHNGVDNYKYMMLVPNLNTDLPVYHEFYHPTCYDNADAQGNYYLQIRPGLALDRNNWRFTGDATKQSWVCAAGAFGHFGLRAVDPADISSPLLATTEGRAWGLYHHGATHTFVGNPIRIHHPTIPGYHTAPNNCDPETKDWYREALWYSGNLLCRGSNANSWSDEINRNAWTRNLDWDNDSSVSSVNVCNGSPTHDFETYAQCYMNGATKVCPVNNAC